jgi:hypothetical protein
MFKSCSVVCNVRFIIILNKQDGRICRPKQGTLAGCFENCDQLSVFVKFFRFVSPAKFGNNLIVVTDSSLWISLIYLTLIMDRGLAVA